MPARKMPEPYRLADRVQKELTRKILKRLNDLKSNFNVLGFDELNVVNGMKALYDSVFEDIKKFYRALYRERYIEMCMWLSGKMPNEDFLNEMVDLWLLDFLEEPNEIYHYAFHSELLRKRDRAIEAEESEPTRIQKQLSMEKHLRFVIQMAAWFTDMVSQDAEYAALKDFGAAKVRWNVYGDEKVCQKCFDLDEKVFLIDKVPPRQHLNCRCYLTVV